jgi:hypothetical protein
MSTNAKVSTWYAFGAEGSPVLHCAECGACIDLGAPSLDHHPAVCPRCGVECAYLNWKGRTVQVVLKNAPPVLARAVRLAQEHFDELEYVEFVTALEEVMDALYAAPGRLKEDP